MGRRSQWPPRLAVQQARSGLKPAESHLEATEAHDEMRRILKTRLLRRSRRQPPTVQPERARQIAKKPEREAVSLLRLPPRFLQEPAMSRYVSFRDFDWVLLVLVLLICALGVVEIYSATLGTKFVGVHIKQVYWVLGGVALMFMVSVLNYQALLETRAAVLHDLDCLPGGSGTIWQEVSGRAALGPNRLLPLPAVGMGEAGADPGDGQVFRRQRSANATAQDIVKAGALVGVPMLMVLSQPDLGTALTYLPIAIMGLFLGGMKAKHALGHPARLVRCWRR